mmetsp:Transcript_34886/g.75438  ORF Transcript_34886/g.75438 Transcript_34886/m.75438 type:complete len:405 (+) Transcript_34886:3-1217(+)
MALTADRLQVAESVVLLFTRDGDNPNNLYDMQNMWYEIKYGNACLRLGQYGKALKKFLLVEKHFADFVEDQFDFHSYCVRKMTIRSYVSLLRLEDRIYGQKFFVRAALGCVRAYLALFDKPRLTKEQEEERELAGLDEKERKKILSKRRRAEARSGAPEAAAAKEEDKTKGGKGGKRNQSTDTDPDGDELTKVEDPLALAIKYLRMLEDHAGGNIKLHHLAAEVWMRRGKTLLFLQSVKRALALDASHPDTHRAVIKFLSFVEERKAGLPAPVVAALEAELALLPASCAGSPSQVNNRWRETEGGKGLAHMFAYSEMAVRIDASAKAAAVGAVVAADCTLPPLHHVRVAHAAHAWLDAVDPAAAATFSARCKAAYPLDQKFSPELLDDTSAGGAPVAAPAATPS